MRGHDEHAGRLGASSQQQEIMHTAIKEQIATLQLQQQQLQSQTALEHRVLVERLDDLSLKVWR